MFRPHIEVCNGDIATAVPIGLFVRESFKTSMLFESQANFGSQLLKCVFEFVAEELPNERGRGERVAPAEFSSRKGLTCCRWYVRFHV